VAVLDTFQPAPFDGAAITHLLQGTPAIPTLVLLHEHGGHRQPRGRKQTRGTEDYARLPAPIDELVLRVQALILRAGLRLPVEPTTTRHGQVLAVFGLKGGIGRSTIAANLAVGLTQNYGYRVALVDGDLWYSAQRALLDLHGDRDITRLRHLGAELDEHALSEVLVPHASGVQVLLAPAEPTLVETIPPDLLAQAAAAYRAQFDFVIVDTHPSMEEYVLQVLDIADRIMLVTTPELGPIRSTVEVLHLAEKLGWEQKLMLVVNRADSGVDTDHLAAALGRPVEATIVSAGKPVLAAGNLGKPLLMTDRDGTERITRDLNRLVARVAGEPEPGTASGGAAPRRSLWSWCARWWGTTAAKSAAPSL
jgi:pilus assembly protein CpaE